MLSPVKQAPSPVNLYPLHVEAATLAEPPEETGRDPEPDSATTLGVRGLWAISGSTSSSGGRQQLSLSPGGVGGEDQFRRQGQRDPGETCTHGSALQHWVCLQALSSLPTVQAAGEEPV